jgi:hypothetical protein
LRECGDASAVTTEGGSRVILIRRNEKEERARKRRETKVDEKDVGAE